MESTDLFLRFVERYVDKDRKPRWRELASKPLAVFKNLTQLEAQIDERWPRVEPAAAADLLTAFVSRHQPVWCWNFGTSAPDRLASAADSSTVNPRRAFLAMSEDGGDALFFNGDMTCWICGSWKP